MPYYINVSLLFLAHLFPLLGQHALGEFRLKYVRHLKKDLSIIKKENKFLRKKWQFLQEGKVPVLHRILPQAVVFLGICD